MAYPNMVAVQGPRGTDSTRGRSGAIWNHMPADIMTQGIHFFDDFLDFDVIASGESHGGWYSVIGTDMTIKTATDEVGGVVELTAGATDDKGATLTLGDNISGAFKIAKGSGKRLWFEARIKAVTILNDYSLFCGFAEEALGGEDALLADVGNPTAKDMVGFHIDEANGDAMDFIHNQAAEATHTVKKAGIHVPVADTYFKVGLTFDGKNTIFPWINGVTTKGNQVLANATNFPDSEEMTFYYVLRNKTDTPTIAIDWVEIAMEI